MSISFTILSFFCWGRPLAEIVLHCPFHHLDGCGVLMVPNIQCTRLFDPKGIPIWNPATLCTSSRRSSRVLPLWWGIPDRTGTSLILNKQIFYLAQNYQERLWMTQRRRFQGAPNLLLQFVEWPFEHPFVKQLLGGGISQSSFGSSPDPAGLPGRWGCLVRSP